MYIIFVYIDLFDLTFTISILMGSDKSLGKIAKKNNN